MTTSSHASGPWMDEIGVVGLVPETWGPPWTVRHQVMRRLAKYYHVVWMTPPLEWRSWWLEGERLEADTPSAIDGLTIYNPSRWLPRVYRPAFAARLTERQRLRNARTLLTRRGAREICLYVWRPEFGSALDLLDHAASCYHIDDEYTFSTVERETTATERALIEAADQVIIHSPGLLEKKGDLNPRTLFVPNGVDYAAYSTPRAEPVDLQAVPHPRVGYVGVIKSQLNLPLLLELSTLHPSWSFVMVGPEGSLYDHAPVVAELKRRDNLYFLGSKPLDALPAYTQHMDVSMLIYEMNDYTRYIYPLKLHECLATGRPIVASPIRTLREFTDVLTLADGVEGWSAALAEALSPEAMHPSRVQARRDVAKQHDWDRLSQKIARSLSELLGPRQRSRFERLEHE